MKDKKLLIYGLGTTGLSAIDALAEDNTLYIYDDNSARMESFGASLPVYEDQEIDLVVKSPGIPLESGRLVDLAARNIPIISDVELAYRISECENFVAISGTNGKTTITDLLYHMLLDGGKTAYMGGNVGIGILPLAKRAKKDDILVVECSSFQLETVINFRPKVAILTNITEDHLDHHKSVDAYRESKKNIYKNQREGDHLILNIDDPYLALLGEEAEGALVVSTAPVRQDGAFLDGGTLYIRYGSDLIPFMEREEMLLPGDHNVRNALEAALCAYLMGVSPKSVRETLMHYKGVDHRMEFLGEFAGIRVYNDSKGTNPDSTDVALAGLEGPIRLLAGGFSKGSDFVPLFHRHRDKIAGLYLFGETKDLMAEEARGEGIEEIHTFETLNEATKAATDAALSGDTLLLSPACASWDQFKNFEERGDLFKTLIAEKWGG
ncbi:UDP-N-acetylmuramoylalanine--D-glutamate ligase [Peptoniphilus ivorii]|uniref:UDP-N-acetylmuramoyl-L-alanine--D-glutamate ligase n=1 Tax=Aedoeadaptatus ivorii TaxID=54006 RepID=UPI0027894828|nr:UDP-N-acetylmuramoyl-L-alanine--D-glutamate ligase [Peptoniphilus ivorii]MDQ0508939.1 UDP-N-acetylmuramoylalanine--D-glutamate ligase [Peptoniphilus ivorii]